MSDKIYFLLLVVGTMSCSAPKVIEQQVSKPDGRYDSEYPVKNLSGELSYISKTVKKLDCIAFYRSYLFSPDNTVDLHQINDSVLELNAVGSSVTNQSVSGTATVVYYANNLVGMLTCAHVVDFPDTVVIRYDNGTGPVEVLSVKLRQSNYVKGLPSGGSTDVVALDKYHDLALLMKRLDDTGGDGVPVLNYPVGRSKELDWGSLVYVMGYPLGNLMVIRAVVSKPAGRLKDRFLTDALYNRGISGSPVLAIRDGIPNFELVGIASSAAAQNFFYVKPDNEAAEYINTDETYSGNLFVDRKRMIKYGVTYNVSIETIMDFLSKNNDQISANGFIPDYFFK